MVEAPVPLNMGLVLVVRYGSSGRREVSDIAPARLLFSFQARREAYKTQLAILATGALPKKAEGNRFAPKTSSKRPLNHMMSRRPPSSSIVLPMKEGFLLKGAERGKLVCDPK